jgi:hypothetical protein
MLGRETSESHAARQAAQIMKLRLGVLIDGGNAHI